MKAIIITLPTTDYTVARDCLIESGGTREMVEGVTTNRTRLVANRIEWQLKEGEEFVSSQVEGETTTMTLSVKRVSAGVAKDLDRLKRDGIILGWK